MSHQICLRNMICKQSRYSSKAAFPESSGCQKSAISRSSDATMRFQRRFGSFAQHKENHLRLSTFSTSSFLFLDFFPVTAPVKSSSSCSVNACALVRICPFSQISMPSVSPGRHILERQLSTPHILPRVVMVRVVFYAIEYSHWRVIKFIGSGGLMELSIR